MDLNSMLQDVLHSASAEGDMETVAGIGNILKKRQKQSPDAAGAPVPPVQPGGMPTGPGTTPVMPTTAAAPTTDPTAPPASTVPDPTAPNPAPETDEGLTPDQQAFYNVAQQAITDKYPDHTVDQVDPGAGLITIEVPNKQSGVADEITLKVDVTPDGKVSLTEQGSEPDSAAEDAADAASGQPSADAAPVGMSRGGKHPIMISVGPRTFDGVQGNGVWVNITNLGTYQHPDYGEVTFTQADFDSWKRNLAQGVIGGKLEDGRNAVAIDYGHSMDDNVPAEQQKAAGYITDLKLDGDRVYAFIEFTPPAAQGVRNKEWPWFSVSVGEIMNQLTGEDTGPALLGGALTARPYIPGLEPIRLSDLRPSKSMKLEQELAAEREKTQKLEMEAKTRRLSDDVAALERAGIPPAIVRLVRPALEADANAPRAITLQHPRGSKQVRLGEVFRDALIELARTGKVPAGEITGHSDYSAVTLSQAVDEVLAEGKKEGKSIRQKDAYVLARKKYPHLRDGSN